MKRNNIFKRIISLVLICLLGLSLVACSGKQVEQPGQEESSSETEVKSLEAAIAEQPAILTSVGQSADVYMVKTLMESMDAEYNLNTVIRADELGDEKTLILAVGGSSKGLGAAGIQAKDELERVEALISKDKEMNMQVIALHVGGEGRRGELSDKFIHVSVPQADYIIVVESGNKDGVFTDIASANAIPMDTVEKITDVSGQLQKAFK